MKSDNSSRVDTRLLGLKWTVVSRPRGSAQIRFRVGKRQIPITTGQKSVSALTKSQQRALIAAWFEKQGPTSSPEIAWEIARFLRLQYEGKAKSTVNEVRLCLEAFISSLGVQRVQEITRPLCESRKDQMQAGKKPKYWKNILTICRKFCRWEVGEGNLKSDPLANFKNPSRKLFGRREKVWEPERYEKTLKLLPPFWREILTVLYETGMDVSDLYQLKPEHIVSVNGPSGKFWKLYKVRAKAKSKDEVIDQPLSTRAREVVLPRLKAWYDFSAYGSAASFGMAIRRRSAEAQRKAGFRPPLDLKSLRHTFASRHAERFLQGKGGPPMEVLRRWMGHAPGSRVLEEVYVHSNSSPLYMP